MADYDFRFAWEGATSAPWGHLLVAQIRAREEMGNLFRYELVVLAKPPAPEVDPGELVGRRATIRITTLTNPPCRVVHGVISEAEELYAAPEGMLYRVVLSPPLVRSKHRKRCRVFLEKSLRQILEAVLAGDPNLLKGEGMAVDPDDGTSTDFSPALEYYTMRIADASRLDDATVRPYVVQYNESDHDFFARLLEEEGLSYHFESGLNVSLLVIADADGGRNRLDPFDPCGPSIGAREVASMKLGARLRPKTVRLDDYDWRKPALMLAADAQKVDEDLAEYHWPGGYQDAPSRGEPLAKFVLERYGVEAEYALGEGKMRLFGAGSIFQLEHNKPRYEGEYLVTAIEIRADQKGVITLDGSQGDVPWSCRFECVRRGKDGTTRDSHFRPARVTPKPRIVGSQTAFVTAAPGAVGAEIHVGGPQDGEIGCVRLRFHWDREAVRHAKEATSCWVRVSQMFTGAGLGAVWHPRVGSEVVVEHVDGDPDRPIVTGRVYNGANLPPAPSVGSPTISTFKSLSTPGGGNYNEFMFDDATGAELIKLHAARDWNSQVLHDRSESIGNNSTSAVRSNRTETTGVNRSTTVGNNNTEIIGVNESVSVGANQTMSIGINQSTSVGVNQNTTVGANQITSVGANQVVNVGANQTTSIAAMHAVTVGGSETVSVGGAQSTTIGAAHTVSVGAAETIDIGGAQTVTVGGSQTISVSGAQTLDAGGAQTFTAPTQTLEAGATITMSAGATITADAPFTAITGSGMLVLTGPVTLVSGSAISIRGSGTVAISGGAVSITGAPVTVNGGPNVDVTAGVIKLN
jgi:type VI secretion system secreted protein VgrG